MQVCVKKCKAYSMALMGLPYIEDGTEVSISVFKGVTILDDHCYHLLSFDGLAITFIQIF
jgi:hypothetical protein